jgi:hypothetical protein
MHTDTTPKEKPTGSANNPAGHTDSEIVSSTAGAGNTFDSLAARFALAGHALTCSNPAVGAGLYCVGRWGFFRALPDLQAAAQFLVQIGSKP